MIHEKEIEIRWRDLDAFESLVKSINDFWLTKVRLPQQRKID